MMHLWGGWPGGLYYTRIDGSTQSVKLGVVSAGFHDHFPLVSFAPVQPSTNKALNSNHRRALQRTYWHRWQVMTFISALLPQP